MKKIMILIAFFLSTSQLFSQTGLRIPFGTEVVLSSGTNLVLNNMDLENEGAFDVLSSNVTVVFSGNANAGMYTPDEFEFYNLKINKNGNATVFLNADILVENEIDMAAGILDLNGYLISLDGGQIINENQNNYIMGSSGRIEYITILNAPNAVNPGNLGIEITSSENLGQTVIRRSHEVQISGNGGYGIKRYFDINPVNNTGLSATLRMYYFDQELNGIPESELGFYRSTDNGTSWEWFGFDILNAAGNFLEKTGIDGFSRWTIGSLTTAPLPLELEFFKGKAELGFNLLEWESLSEENVDYFEIQKLRNQSWQGVGRAEAAHFSTTSVGYHFEDIDYQKEEYYRLRVLDFDGTETFSQVVSIVRNEMEQVIVEVYPNPASDYLNLRFAENQDISLIRLFDAQGRVVSKFTEKTTEIDISNLFDGIYFLEVQSGEGHFFKKITKQ